MLSTSLQDIKASLKDFLCHEKIFIMKKFYNTLKLISMMILLHLPLIMVSQPDPGNNNGGGPLGGGAPIGGGLGILLALALGYGLKKLWDNRRRHLNE
jgi:hypothetical protein